MLQVSKQLHDFANKENLKLAPEKSFFLLLTMKNVGHEIDFDSSEPILSEVVAIHKTAPPTIRKTKWWASLVPWIFIRNLKTTSC